jgi:hypothetical protein
MATGGHGAAMAARRVRVKSVRVIMVKIGLSLRRYLVLGIRARLAGVK